VGRNDRALVGPENPTFQKTDNAMHAGHGNVGGITVSFR